MEAVTIVLAVLLILTCFLVGLLYALTPTVPVKGDTNIPGPGWTLPIIGDAWRFAGITNMKEFLFRMHNILELADRALTVRLGPKLTVFVRDPKMGEAILNSPKAANKDPDIYFGFNEFTDGVFSRNGKPWRDMRRPLNKFLEKNNVMENYYDTFTVKAEKLCESLNDICGKGITSIMYSRIQECMLDIVYETLLGIPANSTYAENRGRLIPDTTSRAVVNCMQMAMNPAYKFQYKSSFFSNLNPLLKEMNRLKSEAIYWGKQIFKSRLEHLKANSIDPHDPLFEPESYADALIQLTYQEPHNDDEYRSLSKPYDLIVAGFDTTSVALASAILFLAQHPEYQEKAYQEQINIMGNTLRAPTREEIDKMDYLWMFYQEVIRHVGVPGVFRVMTSEMVIDDYVFPEGTSVYLSIHYFNMQPEYWVKTKEFYPDNFLPENVAKRPRAAWLPFSSGARVCPGKVFAEAVAKVILSMLLRSFRFTTTTKFSEIEYEWGLMLECANGYPVNVERRSVTAA